MNTEQELVRREQNSPSSSHPAFGGSANAPATVTETPLLPAVDVYENQDEILVLADMPGVTTEGMDVRVQGRELVVRGRQQVTPGLERIPARTFERLFSVPQGVDPAGVSAELRGGVLRLTLKKSEASKPRQIAVRTG